MQEEKQYQDLFYLVEDLKDARKDPMHFLQAIHQTFDAFSARASRLATAA